jgi:hypothetical protein
MLETATAQIVKRDDGIVIARIRAGVRQSLDDARANLQGCIDACAGQRGPLLIDVSVGLPLDAEVRHFYTGEALARAFSALGLLVEASPLGRMMGNVYLRVARLGVPTRLFSDEAGAVAWLRGYLA